MVNLGYLMIPIENVGMKIFGQKEIKELDESLKQSKKNRKEHTKNED